MRPAALAAALLVLAACDDAGVEIQIAPGTTATYTSEVSRSSPGRADSVAYRAVYEQRVVAEGQTVLGERGLTQTVLTYRADDIVLRGTTWYRATPDRLEEVAYASAQAGFLLRGPAADLTLPRLVQTLGLTPGRAAGPADGDSVTVRQPARVVAQYPLRAGQTWLHVESDGLRSTRTVLGEATVQTPAGTVTCWQTRTDLSFDGAPSDIDWVECIDRDGLVERTLRSESVETRPDGSAEAVTWTERTVRTGVAR